MIILNQTSYALLDYLIKLQQPKTITEISKKLSQSRRKIYYHLSKINQALPDNVEKVINYPHIGILLNYNQKLACIHLLNELDTNHYIMNANERKWLIILYVSISNEYITIKKLMNLTDVSRNTVLNDLNNIRDQFEVEQYKIQLRVTKAHGYYIDSHPLSKIQFICKILHQIYKEASVAFRTAVYEKISSLTNFDSYFSKEKLDYLKLLISQVHYDLGKSLNQKDSEFMVQILPYLLMSYHNTKVKTYDFEDVKQDFLLVQERIEYSVATKIVHSLEEKFGISYDDMDKYIIAILLLSFRKDKDTHNHSHDYDDMRNTLDLFLTLFETETQITFQERNNLLDQLLTHCKALIYRKIYNIPSDSPLTEDIKDKYNQLFNTVKKCTPLLEETWLIHMTDDDIAYIAVHLGGAIHHKYNQDTHRKKITLVCDEGIGIRKLFLKQCQKYISKPHIDTVFTLEEFHSVKELLLSDIVISTSDAVETELPLIIVSPILTNKDIINLISIVYSTNTDHTSDFSLKLEQVLKHYINDKNEQYTLRNQIETIFLNELLHYFDNI